MSSSDHTASLGPDDDAPPAAAADGPSSTPRPRGVEWSQGPTSGGARRRIPRDDVAAICHEALTLPRDAAPARATFECWATREHARPMAWRSLQPDSGGGGPLPEVDHTTALAVSLGGTAVVGAAGVRGLWRAARTVVRWLGR